MATKTSWQLELPAADTTLQLGARPLVMGVLNLTPDSFSDGGHFLEVEAAVAHAERLLADGADLLDLGAESTRPGGGVYGTGARDVPASEELDRLLPVLDAVRTRWPDVPLSVDTRKGAVARRALEHGADLINDVGGLSDPEMVEVMTQAACPIVLMHSRGELGTMQTTIDFADVVAEVRDDLAAAVDRAAAAGVARDRLILDPGLGFGKTAPQNLRLIRRLDAFEALDRPLLIGASRKSFLGWAARTRPDGATPPPSDRLGPSLAALSWCARHGVAIVRVHDVRETTSFLRVWATIDAIDCED